jgi:hydrogenase expression/formation protein HypC
MCLAIPGQIVDMPADGSTGATVEVVGVRRRIDLGLLEDDPPRLGDWVLIHVGFAMSRISEADAVDQLDMLRRLGEHEAAVEEAEGYGLGGETGSEDP